LKISLIHQLTPAIAASSSTTFNSLAQLDEKEEKVLKLLKIYGGITTSCPPPTLAY
jgi:hypothetical protein